MEKALLCSDRSWNFVTRNTSSFFFAIFTACVSRFGLCISAFILVGLASKLSTKKPPPRPVIAKSLEEDIEKQEEAWNLDESPAVMLGAGGIYGIVYGLGVTDALGGFAECVEDISVCLSLSTPDIIGTFGLSLPYAFRLVGFLVTIIPFIHGTVLMFSNRWYYNKDEDKYHFGVAFIYFIFAFIHAVLFFFVASNVLETSRFLLTLWVIMLLNVTWLCFQVKITSHMKIKNYFLPSWILINFITVTFFTIFVLRGQNSIDADLEVNLLILTVLASRSVIDYYVGWEGFYNRIPQKGPEEMARLTSYLLRKDKINLKDAQNLRELIFKKFYPADI
jgi:hypothetical protein